MASASASDGRADRGRLREAGLRGSGRRRGDRGPGGRLRSIPSSRRPSPPSAARRPGQVAPAPRRPGPSESREGALFTATTNLGRGSSPAERVSPAPPPVPAARGRHARRLSGPPGARRGLQPVPRGPVTVPPEHQPIYVGCGLYPGWGSGREGRGEGAPPHPGLAPE